MFAMIGALVFLGCPWRAMLRLAGGDWNATLGLVGLTVGTAVGVQLLKSGFSLGRSYPARMVSGLAMPFVMVVLVLLAIFYPQFGQEGKGALFVSKKGPAAASAPVAISLIVGVVIGFLAQRTGFCTYAGRWVSRPAGISLGRRRRRRGCVRDGHAYRCGCGPQLPHGWGAADGAVRRRNWPDRSGYHWDHGA